MRKSVALCLFALLSPLAVSAMAVDSTWNSGTNGAWDSSSNWNNNTVPDQEDRAVVIGANSVANVNAVFPDGGTTVGSLRIGTSAAVNVVSSLTTSGALDAASGFNFDLAASSTLTGAGTVTVAGPARLAGGNLNVTGGTTFQSSIAFNNSSQLSVGGSVTSQGTSTWNTLGLIQVTGSWTNTGVFNRVQGVLGDLRLNGSGTFTNASGGTFNVSGTNPFNVNFTGPTAGTFNNSGTIVVDTTTMNLNGVTFNNLAGGSVNLINNGTFNTSAAAITFNAATLSGQGNFNDNAVVQNGGNIAPGSSPGQLNINGNLTVDASTITIELGGLTQGATANGYDFLNITGNASLLNTPTIAVQLFGGFIPTFGDTFTIVAAASGLNGPLNFDFSQAGGAGMWDTSASTGSSIIIRAVPEPSSLALLGLSAFGLTFRRRRS